MQINKYIDHTNLKPDATIKDIAKLVEEAKKYDTCSVCVNPSYIKYVSDSLKGTGVKTCTVVGFPLGQMKTETKVFEAKTAIADGADEIDMVINVAKLKDAEYSYVENEIKLIKSEIKDKILKVIIETCLLSHQEIIKACETCMKAGADYVKTSTGFSTGGATIEDVKLMKETVGNKLKVKASGGIKDYNKAIAMIEAGAERLGTSSTERILENEK